MGRQRAAEPTELPDTTPLQPHIVIHLCCWVVTADIHCAVTADLCEATELAVRVRGWVDNGAAAVPVRQKRSAASEFYM